jgi:hypothetical protein
MVAINYDELDEGIRHVVRFLNDRGFTTIGSCEGGDSHQFARPTVQIRTGDDLESLRKRLAESLINIGVHGFTLRSVYLYQNTLTPKSYSFLELELWSTEVFPKPR